MDYKKIAISTIAIFAVIKLVKLVVYQLLKEEYEATAHVWKSPEEISKSHIMIFVFILLISLVYSLIFAYIDYKNTVVIGLMIGTLMGLFESMSYAYMPLSLYTAFVWLVAEMIKGLVAGFIVTLF